MKTYTVNSRDEIRDAIGAFDIPMLYFVLFRIQVFFATWLPIMILAELEGIESKNDNLLFIGATNEPWSIDPAALRPGRFDEKIYVPPPDYNARKRIFELNMSGKPVDDLDFETLATLTDGYSGADIRHICVKASLIPFKESIKSGGERGVTMDDMLSVMENIKPSINKAMVKRYGGFKF